MEIVTREYEKKKPKSTLWCNLSHFVSEINTTKSSNVPSEHDIEFVSDSEAISPINQITNKTNITETESLRKAKRKRKTEIPTDTASN